MSGSKYLGAKKVIGVLLLGSVPSVAPLADNMPSKMLESIAETRAATLDHRFGQLARLSISLAAGTNGYTREGSNPELALLIPWNQQPGLALFSHLGVSGNSGTTLFNLGLGFRLLDSVGGYWGSNLFYDYQAGGGYQRLGCGLEKRLHNLSTLLVSLIPEPFMAISTMVSAIPGLCPL